MARNHLLSGFIALLGTTFSAESQRAETAEIVTSQAGHGALISQGGRLYDNHWSALGRPWPNARHKLYPKDAKATPYTTWRCVSCHGWDYKGSNGHLGNLSSSFVDISGAAGRDPAKILKILTSKAHAEIVSDLPEPELAALAKFIAYGQHDISTILRRNGKAIGDPARGKDIYEGVCSRCHQDDGKASLYGERGDKSSLGWLARNRPEQAIHKIRNGITSADMLSLRFLSLQGIGDLIAYLQSMDKE